jgi:hypothetical protein
MAYQEFYRALFQTLLNWLIHKVHVRYIKKAAPINENDLKRGG